MKKRIFAAFIAAALSLTAFSAFAEFDPNKVAVADDVISTKMIEAPLSGITLNGSSIEAPDFYEKDGVIMLPLRALTEAMGFAVEWQGETGTIILTRGPVYITMNAFADGYTFSKMAPVMLGTAPVLENGVTFVPETFVTEVLGGAYRTNGSSLIEIFDSEHKNIALIDAIDTENKQITVNDIVKGAVVLNIAEDAAIFDEEANAVKFEDLKVGMTLRVQYSEAMTRSLPPQNTPDSIVVLSGSPAAILPSDELVAIADVAVVASVDTEQNTVVVNDTVKGEVILILSEDTKVTGLDGADIKTADLKEGMTVEVEYGDAMTMSIPPINNPKSLKVISETATVEIQPVENLPVAE